MHSPLDSTFGVWFICLWIQTLLQGCGLLQAFLYFHWYPNDRWGTKSLVIFLIIIESFQLVVFFQVTYFYLITHFGDTANLDVIYWQDAAQLLSTYLSAFAVQLYFAYSIYYLDRTLWLRVIAIVLLALTGIGAGLNQTVTTSQLHLFSDLGKTKIVSTLQAAATLCCDVMITATLLSSLRKHKGAIKTTNNLLNRLMVIAVNRGVLTALCAMINMILFVAKPDTYYFFFGLELSGKLYMNSALATLNSRKHIAAKAFTTSTESENAVGQWNAISMSNMSRNGRPRTLQEPPTMHILVEHQIQRKSDEDLKKARDMGEAAV